MLALQLVALLATAAPQKLDLVIERGRVKVDGRNFQTSVPQGVVNEAAVQATPEDRRPWLPVSSVARSLEPGLAISADLSGGPLILAMQRTPASEYVLLENDGEIFGVLVTDDVDRAFSADRG